MSPSDARLALAERFLELAEHSSEIEMRNSLSRMYYALHHVAIALTGRAAHGEIPAALEQVESGSGAVYRHMLNLRHQADYDPEFVRRRFGTLDEFRIQYPQLMEDARDLYDRLRAKVTG